MTKRIRRESRELALQALYYMDSHKFDFDNIDQTLETFFEHFGTVELSKPFFVQLAKGVFESLNEIDALIEKTSTNWKLHRMSLVDRNIIRIAVYELLFCETIPQKVTINEAVDISKEYGTDDSGAFINGILDSIHKNLETSKPQKQGVFNDA